MPDRYKSVAELLKAERDNVKIVAKKKGRTPVAILGLHAGGIEPLTGEIAQAIAGRDHRLYLFVGVAPSNNARLHITSTRFDEPKLRYVLDGARTAVSIHGAAGTHERLTQIGGRNRALKERIADSLDRHGFNVVEAQDRLDAQSPNNAVNRVLLGGVQMELSLGLRDSFLRGGLNTRTDRENLRNRTKVFERYVSAVRRALDEEGGDLCRLASRWLTWR